MNSAQTPISLSQPIEADFGTEAWSVLRIMTEFVNGFEALKDIAPAVTIFGSARLPQEHPCCYLAEEIARRLSEAGFAVITGGGPGVMEAANRGAFHGPSRSVGLSISLPHEQTINPCQNITLNFQHFSVRKEMLMRYASAFVVLPGGFGTLDELSEILNLMQNSKMSPVPVILVHSKFWQGLLDWFRDVLLAENVIDAQQIELIMLADDVETVLQKIQTACDSRKYG